MLSLSELAKDFPYSQQIQELYLKALYQNQSIKFESELKKTAAFACDRACLKAYILDDSFEKELKRKPILTIVPADSEELIEHKNKKVHAGSPVDNESGDSEQFQERDPDKQEGNTEKNTPSKLDIKREELPQNKEREEKNQKEEAKTPRSSTKDNIHETIKETIKESEQQDYDSAKTPNTILDPELNDGFLSEAIHASISMEVNNRNPSPSATDEQKAEQKVEHKVEHKAEKAHGQTTDQNIDQNTEPDTSIDTGLETGQNTHKKQEHLHTTNAKNFPVPQKEDKKQAEDKKSFIQWIKHYDQETREKEIERVNFKQKASTLIDAFISNQPKIKPKKDFYSAVDMASKSIEDHQEAISETLAKIIFSQKNYKKAIEMYQALSLKFPEKKAYFANQIQAIRIAQKK